jgi:hypothetical protein
MLALPPVSATARPGRDSVRGPMPRLRLRLRILELRLRLTNPTTNPGIFTKYDTVAPVLNGYRAGPINRGRFFIQD